MCSIIIIRKNRWLNQYKKVCSNYIDIYRSVDINMIMKLTSILILNLIIFSATLILTSTSTLILVSHLNRFLLLNLTNTITKIPTKISYVEITHTHTPLPLSLLQRWNRSTTRQQSGVDCQCSSQLQYLGEHGFITSLHMRIVLRYTHRG